MSDSNPPLHFLIGAPFSGARRLMHALNQHPSICAIETQLFGGFMDPRPPHPRAKGPRLTFDRYVQCLADFFPYKALDYERREFVEEFLEAYIEFITAYVRKKSGKSVLVDTVVPYPGTSRRIADMLTSRFPEAKCIFLLRDGRDVVTEATFDTLAHDGHGTDRYALFVENRPHVVLNRFFDDQALVRNAKNWAETITAQPRFGDNTCSLAYEDLELRGSESLAMILDHFEINEPLPAKLTEIGPGQLTERPSTKHFREFLEPHPQDWTAFFTRRDGDLFEEVAGRQLKRAGFESNDDWRQALPEKLQLQSA